jgi:Tfp pilus assembly protein PilW
MVTRAFRDERGFSLVEMMISAGLTMAVVGAAVVLSSGVQNVYSVELEDAAVQQEARYALDWISRTIAAGSSNPYDIGGEVDEADSCVAEEPNFDLDIDDDMTNETDAIRVTADVNPPNGLLGGDDDCSPSEPGEDVTIALAADGDRFYLIKTDPAQDGGAAVAMTDSVISDLEFTYLDSARNVTTAADSVRYVQIALTVQSKARNPYTGEYTTYTYESEVRVRSK